MTMRWLTLPDWRDNGYRVIKGMKSTKRDDSGAALFNEHQVTRRRSYSTGILPGDNSDHANGDF